jgi:hypothetical protein
MPAYARREIVILSGRFRPFALIEDRSPHAARSPRPHLRRARRPRSAVHRRVLWYFGSGARCGPGAVVVLRALAGRDDGVKRRHVDAAAGLVRDRGRRLLGVHGGRRPQQLPLPDHLADARADRRPPGLVQRRLRVAVEERRERPAAGAAARRPVRVRRQLRGQPTTVTSARLDI